MIAASWRRPLGVLSVGLLGMAAVAGCGSEVQGEGSASTSSSSSSSSASAGASSRTGDVEDLSAGLLPAEAFGAGAQLTPITADQLAAQPDQLGGGLGALQDLTITPESCAPAVKQVQPGLDDMDGLAAQTATTGTSATIEILAAGAAVSGSLDSFTSGIQACPQATISSPEIGTATVTFSPLDVPAVGDGSAGLTMSISATGPDGTPITVPLLLAMAIDGDRLVSLTATDPTGAPDPAAFAQLFQQAYDHQADALD
jgi:hypothetical protein